MGMDVRRAFWIFAVLTVLAMVSDRLLFVIFPVYLIEKNFSATLIGIIFSVASLMMLLSRTVIGKLSDRFGRKHILSAGLLFEAFSISLFPSLSRLSEFAIVKGFREFAFTLKESVEDALIADAFKKSIRTRILVKLGTIFPLSRALAAIIGFFIVAYLTITAGFYVASAALLIAAVVFALFFKETKRTKWKNEKPSLRGYSKTFIIIALIGFLESVNFNAAYFPAFFLLVRNVGLSTANLFLLMLVSYVISAVFVHASRKWTISSSGRVVVLGLFFFSLFSIFYGFVSTVFQLVLIFIGISLAFYTWRPAFKTVLYNASTPRFRGEQLGFANTLTGIGDMVGPVLGGLLVDNISLQSAFWAAGVAGFLAVMLALSVRR